MVSDCFIGQLIAIVGRLHGGGFNQLVLLGFAHEGKGEAQRQIKQLARISFAPQTQLAALAPWGIADQYIDPPKHE